MITKFEKSIDILLGALLWFDSDVPSFGVSLFAVEQKKGLPNT